MNKGAKGSWPYDEIVEIPGELAGIAALGIKIKQNALARIDFFDLQKHSLSCLIKKNNDNLSKVLSGSGKRFETDGDVYTNVIVDQLNHYFENPAWQFTVKTKVTGTDFQQNVWRSLKSINHKKHCTYGELAKKLSTSPRAIGGACRSNPVPIVVPCHRVVSANGPGGYCGVGDAELSKMKLNDAVSFELKIKTWLQEHEKNSGRA